MCWHSARADAPQQVSKRPNNASVHDFIAADIAKHPVLVYMKGTPTAPQCGFSNIVCKVLDSHGTAWCARRLRCKRSHERHACVRRRAVREPQRFTRCRAAGRHQDFHVRGLQLVHHLRSASSCLAAHWRSNWPTIPQVFIAGEFVGGSDILMGMHTSGELAEQLQKLKQK